MVLNKKGWHKITLMLEAITFFYAREKKLFTL